MSELLPCPICGGEPFMIPRAVMYPDWWQCSITHAGNDGHHVRVIVQGDTEQEAIDAAVAAWNRRYERTCAECVMIPSFTKYMTLDDCQEFCCSACGEYMVLQQFPECLNDTPNFCPNCGAKVVKE